MIAEDKISPTPPIERLQIKFFNEMGSSQNALAKVIKVLSSRGGGW